MSRTITLSFLAIAVFTVAGADYYVQARHAQQDVQSYGVARYKESIVARVGDQMDQRVQATGETAPPRQDAERGQIKTRTLVNTEATRNVDDVIPEVWERLKVSRDEKSRLPQVATQRGGRGISFHPARVAPSE